MWIFYRLVFSCKVFRAFLFLLIRSSIHSISTFFFAWRKLADLAVISNKWMEENFAAFRGNFCDKCPQAKLPLESSYLGGNSPGGKFPRVHLSLGAIAREVKIGGGNYSWINYSRGQLFCGAIIRGQLSGGQFSSWTIVRTPHDRCKIFHYTFQFSTLLLYTLLSKLELFVVNRNFYRLRGVLNERQSGQCSYRNKCPKIYFPVFPRLKHVVN